MGTYKSSNILFSVNCPSIPNLPLLLAVVLSLLLLQAVISPATAAETPNTTENTKKDPGPADIAAELDKIERSIKADSPSIEQLDKFLSALARSRNWGEKCTNEQQNLLTKTEELLTAIGERVTGEAADVSKQRAKLKTDKSEIEKKLATCHVIFQRSDQLSSDVATIKKNIQAREIFAKGDGLLSLLKKSVSDPGVWLEATRKFVTDTSAPAKISRADALVFTLVTGLAMVIGWYIRVRTVAVIARTDKPENASERFFMSLLLTVRRYTIALLGTLTAAVFFYLHGRDLQPVPFINIVAYGLPLVLLMTAAVNLFLKPLPSALPSEHERTSNAARLSHRVKVLIILIFIGYLLFATILSQSLPETIFLLARLLYGVFLIINVIWILWLLGSDKHDKRRMFLRVLVTILLTASLVSAIVGYHNLAQYVFKFVIGTMLVLGIYFVSSNFLRGQLDALDEDKGSWQHRLRSMLGLKSDQQVPGMLWIRLLLTVGLWTGLFVALTEIWQVPAATIENFESHLIHGFAIGSFTLKPVSILQSILVLSLLLTVNTWFKKWLEQEWLTRAHMDRGARESVATISGYVGASLAVLVALSVAGMDFSKLAIIAGALSVGIGFGLQNIVSNFISGLILLFERPVKTGDWIIVGDVEGYVKRISIRTTQIMTFDRADVIVPNNELISGNVTNLMLHDLRGRIRVPVGVAYGSDTQKVKELMLEVANGHPEVMGEGFGVTAPFVLFIEFGDSSLNFELRCFVANIDRRRRVISDINFAIDEAFREHGIEIPFPQRDIHIRKNAADTGASIPVDPKNDSEPEK